MSCTLKAQDESVDENIVRLMEDQPAPMDGYLTEPLTFREMIKDIKQGKIYRSEFEKCLEQKQAPPTDNAVLWFGVGVVTTMITMYVTSQLIK